MKKILYILLTFTVVINYSCTNEELISSVEKEFLFLSTDNTEKFFARPGTGEEVPAEINLIYHGTQSSTINYTFEILESSTAVEGTHYTVNGTTASFAADSITAELPISIIPDNLVTCETVTIDVRLVSSDIADTKTGTASFNLGVEGGSELAGLVDYVNTANFGGSDVSGTAEIIATSVPGIYTIDDFSFGTWAAFYSIPPPTGTLQWANNCSMIELSGTDNYGDVWQFDEVLASDGPVFTFVYSNTYGEFGQVSLTRQDGKDWPKLEL